MSVPYMKFEKRTSLGGIAYSKINSSESEAIRVLVFDWVGLGDKETRYAFTAVKAQVEKEAVEGGKTSLVIVAFPNTTQMRKGLWRGAKMTKGAWVRSQGFSVVSSKKELDRFVTSFLEDGEICT